MVSVAGSFVLVLALLAIRVLFHSQLALAQAADSASDVLAGSVLAWAVRVASRPPDADHPLGHRRAEPIAALVIAVLAGALAVEVGQQAIDAIGGGARALLEWPVAAVFAAKVVFKAGIALFARRTSGSPALDALATDARNDVLVGVVALLGFAGGRWGWPAIDAWLALAVAAYVAYSGVRLARDSVGILMGEAAPEARRAELERVVASVIGVVRVDATTVTRHGDALEVDTEIAVDGTLSLARAHAIGHAVQARLTEEPDVVRARVHVDGA